MKQVYLQEDLIFPLNHVAKIDGILNAKQENGREAQDDRLYQENPFAFGWSGTEFADAIGDFVDHGLTGRLALGSN